MISFCYREAESYYRGCNLVWALCIPDTGLSVSSNPGGANAAESQIDLSRQAALELHDAAYRQADSILPD